jgi:hypothetical protein
MCFVRKTFDRLYIEDTFINVILDLIDECIPNNMLYKNQQSNSRFRLSKDLFLLPKIVVDQVRSYSEPIRLRSIKLGSLEILGSPSGLARSLTSSFIKDHGASWLD